MQALDWLSLRAVPFGFLELWGVVEKMRIQYPIPTISKRTALNVLDCRLKFGSLYYL